MVCTEESGGRLVCMKRNTIPAEITPSALLGPLNGSKDICSASVGPKISEKVVKEQKGLGKPCSGGSGLPRNLTATTYCKPNKEKETKRSAS